MENLTLTGVKSTWKTRGKTLHILSTMGIFSTENCSPFSVLTVLHRLLHSQSTTFAQGFSQSFAQELSIELLPDGRKLFAQGEILFQICVNLAHAVHNSGVVLHADFVRDFVGG